MKLDGLRMALYVAAASLYVYWVAEPVGRWLLGGPGQASVEGPDAGWELAVVLLVVAVLTAPLAVLYRVLRGRWR